MKKLTTIILMMAMMILTSCKKSEELNNDTPTPTPIPPKSLPVINSFTADKMNVEVGESTTIRWNVSNALKVELFSNITIPLGVVPSVGSIVVYPKTAYSSYTVYGYNNDGYVFKMIEIKVNVPEPPVAPNVEYRVSGSAYSVFITYANKTEGTSQEYANVPWTYSWSGAKSGQFLYVSAQNQWETGSVTVEIYKNGSLYKTSTSSGAYVIATASGSY